ncbi:MAG: IS66 family transposase [Thaumarchaeota archaeon]|nr:IS66 family transposase [Nitrososphaerota archaeon]
MSEDGPAISNEEFVGELQRYKELCRRLEEENVRLRAENAKMREELLALKTTVSAVVARSIDAKADAGGRRRYKKSGRRNGHQGASRSRPEHIDETIELDQSTYPRCGGVLSENHTDSYTRIVEDIVPARIVVTEYVVKRRYCCRCRKQVSPPIPNVINDGGSNERFGLRLMLLIVSLKLLGLSYEKIGAHLKLLFDLDLTEAAMFHCVMTVADAFGPRYEELKDELRKEASLHGDETSWRIKGKNHWLWAFLGRWSVVYEVDRSRGKDVPQKVLGDYEGTVISDSWPAWNHVGKEHQRCLIHYLRQIEDTLKYKSPGAEFAPFAKKLRRILRDSIRAGERVKDPVERLRVKGRLEARIDMLIASYSSCVDERNCTRFFKRLRRERGMLFTFLDEEGVDWNNNAAERALRSSVVIRKITYGNQSDEGARTHAVLMSIRETCGLRKKNFFNYAMKYLGQPTSKR